MPDYKIEVYYDGAGWCWRLIAKNGKTIAESPESHLKKRECLKPIEDFISLVNNTHSWTEVVNFVEV